MAQGNQAAGESLVWFITGCSTGFGRDLARHVLARGYRAVVTARKPDDLQEFSGSSQALVLKLDVTDNAQIDAAVKAAHDRFGCIDVLVNNAGITRDGLLMRMKDEDWEAVLKTNLTGVYNCTKAVTKGMMKQRYGRIINMTSVVGVTGNAGQANYAAAKAGVIGLTKSTAKELGSRAITANAIAPGFIESDMTAGLPEKNKQEMAAAIPLGKFGQPADVAQAVVFLASDWASYITGQTLHVDGGMVM